MGDAIKVGLLADVVGFLAALAMVGLLFGY